MARRWEFEAWRKLYVRVDSKWLALPALARGLASELIKYADDDGRIHVGEETPADAIARILSAQRSELPLIRRHVDALLVDGCLVLETGAIIFRNFIRAQGRSSNAERQARWREKRAADALPVDVTDAVTSNATNNVTGVTPPLCNEVTDRGISLPPSGSGSLPGSGSSQDPLAALPSESIQRATEQLTLSAPDEPDVSPAEQVFAVYLVGWRRHVGKGTEPVLDDRRRALVKARLRVFGLEDLKGAAAGVWRSTWNVRERRTAFDLVMRDSAHVEQFRDMPADGEAPAIRRELQQPAPPGVMPTYTVGTGQEFFDELEQETH